MNFIELGLALCKMALMGTASGLLGTMTLVLCVEAIKRWKKGGCKCQNKQSIKVEDQERK